MQLEALGLTPVEELFYRAGIGGARIAITMLAVKNSMKRRLARSPR